MRRFKELEGAWEEPGVIGTRVEIEKDRITVLWRNAPVLETALFSVGVDRKLRDRIADGLSQMDKSAEIQRDKKGNILYDKDTKDTETVKYEEDIDTYMQREVLPHIPDAKAFFEENLTGKNPVLRTGAEIPFTRYFYKYQQPRPSEELAAEFLALEKSVSARIAELFQ
jgi:type I restriction enzyme M protein